VVEKGEEAGDQKMDAVDTRLLTLLITNCLLGLGQLFPVSASPQIPWSGTIRQLGRLSRDSN
jgi:hypothetical protein